MSSVTLVVKNPLIAKTSTFPSRAEAGRAASMARSPEGVKIAVLDV
jgi:hypothetical protein